MKKEDALKNIPKEGFLKLAEERVEIPEEKRVALIRRGNELFNKGNIELAKKVFLTTRYADGLIRLGDKYIALKKPLEAFRMYWIAQSANKRDALVQRMACVIKNWLKEER
ncbi:MAG: hypothetical protein EHM28_06400 [Spirochaetaceae bacterium]|nr:MAG: hypothetical protein EHM28_06400 [Spirochaetaceae bacterium]